MNTLAAAPSPHETASNPPPDGRRGRTVAVIIAAVLVVLAGLVGWWLIARPASVDLGSVDSATTQVLADLQSAQTTTDVRAAAAAADTEVDAVQAVLARDATGASTRTAVQARLAVLAQVSDLQRLTADTLDQWATVRPRLSLALAALPDDAAPLRTVGAQSVTALDQLISRAQAAMADWAAQRDAAMAAGQQNLALAAAVDTYRGTVMAQLALYESLRSQTTAQVKALRNVASDDDLWRVYSQLSAGERDREAVLAALGATAVPAGLEDEHNRMLGMVQDSIVAMRAVQRAIDEANYARYQDYWGEGPVPALVITQAPSWEVFASTSARIDRELPAVQAAVQDQADELIAEYQQAVPVPPKPTV